MKIIYIHQYFKTQAEGGAIRSFYISQALKNKGHDVHIVTAHDKPALEVKSIEGTTVYYLPVNYDNSYGFFKRVFSFLTFTWKAYRVCRSIKKADLVYASSTPLTVGLIALALRRFQHIPYIFEVRDLWPEAPIQLGYLNNTALKFAAKCIEKSIYNKALHVVALSPGMQEGIQAVSKTPVTVVSNMSDCDFFIPAKPVSLSPIVVTYFGAVGKVNRMDSFLSLAKYASLHFPHHYQFIVAGQGSELNRIKAEALALENMVFMGHLDKVGIKKLLEATHVSYISFGPEAILETNSPNKFFDSIAMGKLCVITTKGWIKTLIEKNRIGFYHDGKDAAHFFSSVQSLCNTNSLEDISRRARSLALHDFEKNTLTAQVVSILEQQVTQP
jgi:glycosyltransferase involved in cell wall biosynthesis